MDLVEIWFILSCFIGFTGGVKVRNLNYKRQGGGNKAVGLTHVAVGRNKHRKQLDNE